MDDITRRTFFGRAAAPSGPRADWPALTDEAVLEPTPPIIDPHHHLWDRPGNRYLLEELQRLKAETRP